MKPHIQSIGPHAVEADMGRGRMGLVYRATDTRLGRAVAIKTLPEATTLNLLIGFDRVVDGKE